MINKKMSPSIPIALLTILLFLLLTPSSQSTPSSQNLGQTRLHRLKQRLQSSRSGSIIPFTAQDFNQYAMQYPRPYNLVIYFTGSSCKLCDQLKQQYQYMATLYDQQGAIRSVKNPVFFVTITFGKQTMAIFQMFGFKSIPNLVVSKPQMPLISELQKKLYLQKFKWAISYSDGDVTTHKMLDFVNQRTSHSVFYKPPLKTMLTMFFGFIAVVGLGVVIYTQLRSLWTHWLVWLVGVLLIYITCVSGVVYNIIHDVPFVGRDKDTGEPVVFAGGNRQQYGAQGFVVSFVICLIGVLFVLIVVVGEKVSNAYKVRIFGLLALLGIFMLTSMLESVYKTKSWYGPSFFPPQDYSRGSIATDQGNNI